MYIFFDIIIRERIKRIKIIFTATANVSTGCLSLVKLYLRYLEYDTKHLSLPEIFPSFENILSKYKQIN